MIPAQAGSSADQRRFLLSGRFAPSSCFTPYNDNLACQPISGYNNDIYEAGVRAKCQPAWRLAKPLGELQMVDLAKSMPDPLTGATMTERSCSTAIESVYATLRDRIIEGAYPHGSKLRLERLKSAFGVSGSTIREALTRLIGDHLVIAEGQKGFRVAPMSLADLEDLTMARVVVESSALADSIRLGGEDWEDHLLSTFHRLAKAQERLEADPVRAFDAWEMRNKEFHEALVAAAPSKWLERLRLMLFSNSERYRRLSGTAGPVPVEVHQEHTEIFEAAMARDVDRAVSALRHHIHRAANVIRSNRLLED